MKAFRNLYLRQLKAWFIFLPVISLFTLLLTEDLAIPGPITQVAKKKTVAAPVSLPFRTAHEMKMDAIMGRFKTGLKSIENRHLIDFIHQESRRYGFDPELILAVIHIESSFYNWSVSKKGALGMMQLIPATGRAMAKRTSVSWKGEKESLFDPYVNIRLGIRYLYSLTQQFPNLHTALTAYNYGPTRVRQMIRRGKKLPTRYANRILNAYVSYLRMQAPPRNAT